jgi:hypothetical protein
MNGMMFGGEGPVMQGTWYDPNTGDAFTVRDSFFEDNQYVVTTTDGRYLNYNQLQSYIQTDMKLEDLKKARTENNQNASKNQLPPEVADLISENGGDPYASMMTPEDMMIGNNKPNLGNLYRDDLPVQQTPVGNVYVDTYNNAGKGQSMNEAIIEKALKNAEKPEFNVDVIWDNFPLKQIEMLKDIMEIPEDEIIDWYLDNIEMMEVVDALKTAIRSKILCSEGEELANQIKAIVPDITLVNPCYDNCCYPGFYIDMTDNANSLDSSKQSYEDKFQHTIAGDITPATSAKKTTKKSSKKTTKKS